MGNILLYMHAGSGNHGCEAIVNSLCNIIKEDDKDANISLLSYRVNEDEKYTLKSLCNLISERSFSDHKIMHVLLYGYRAITHDALSFIRYRYKKVLNSSKYPLAISIGGDNYCYDNMLSDLFLSNEAFNKAGTKTCLIGCSVEPKLLSNEKILNDLNKYATIVARESLTFEALKEAGLKDVRLIPDPAFTLKKKEEALPEGFEINNTLGINISPIAQESESQKGITMENYKVMIKHVLDNTDMKVAFIPHVMWKGNDDRDPGHELYTYFKDLGYEDRILEFTDNDCETLKGYISRLRFFVCARTHASIAAYSTMVPTLVVGYSVKAHGIAKDIFTDYFNENEGSSLEDFVVSVQSMKKDSDLRDKVVGLIENEDKIRAYMQKKLPSYIQRAYEIKDVIREAQK